ncbi:hypothetical protein SDC9_141995 [bioreactor metagenome]|uniref:Uncharacterized protein n=1 Tax=bioreactor metagenome TaxID=1076179 RepID=A0A645DZU1_9ZZZZ
MHLGAVAGLLQFLGPDRLAQAAQRGSLGFAPALGERFGEVGEEHGEPQPQRDGQDEAGRCLAFAAERLEEQAGSQHAAQPDHEHHRILDLVARRQPFEGFDRGFAQQRRIEHGLRRLHQILLSGRRSFAGVQRWGPGPMQAGRSARRPRRRCRSAA